MRGTPFYTAETQEMKNPERIPLWPLLYYEKNQILSVLWPLMELSDEHFAFRPVFSVHGLDEQHHTYNVVWPFARFNEKSRRHYVFPMFWGPDYFNAFPLYWHRTWNDGDGVSDVLWPLWSYQSDQHGRRTRVLSPFIQFKDYRGETGFHIWPLAGHYEDRKGDTLSYLLWPIGHAWAAGDGNSGGHTVIPLYVYRREADERLFVSIPYSRFKDGDDKGWQLLMPLFFQSADGKASCFISPLYSQAKTRAGSSWQCVPPLFFHKAGPHDSTWLTPLYSQGSSDDGEEAWHHLLPLWYSSKKGDRFRWITLPLLSGGVHKPGKHNAWFLGPLAHSRADTKAGSRASHVLPLYISSKSEKGSTFLSVPWSHGRGKDGSSWQCVPPLFYHEGGPHDSTWLTPLYSQGTSRDGDEAWRLLPPLWYSKKNGDRSRWMALPLLTGGVYEPGKHEAWFLGPLAHSRADAGSRTHYVLPLYVSTRDRAGSAFVSLPWMQGKNADGRSWQVIPGLYANFADKDGKTMLTPLYAAGSAAKEGLDWHAVLPLYYRRRSEKDGNMFATLLGGFTTDKDGRQWLAYPLLSWGKKGPDSGEFWAAAPLCHASWNAEGASHHLLPLYYWNGRNRTLVSPLASRWQHKDGRATTLVPPALSWLTSGEQRSDLWMAGPLFHWSWGEDAGARHILPLMYANPRTGTFASPLVARWRDGEKKTTLVPPALSWLTSGEQRSDLWMAAPLFHWSWGEEAGTRHLFPLMYANRRTGIFASPLFARWGDNEKTTSFVPPALSWYTSTPTEKDLWILGSLARFQWGDKPGRSHVLPLYYADHRTGTFLSLPYASWGRDGYKTRAVPPALSWYSSSTRRKDLWAAAGLMHWSWGERPGPSHIFPLFYHDPSADEFLSLPYATWRDGSTRHQLYPPLLSLYSTDGKRKELNALLGLFSETWGDGKREGYLFPLYMHEGSREFYSLLMGRNGDEHNGWFYPLTPLIGFHTGDHSGGWLFPLLTHKKTKETGDYGGTFLWGRYWKRDRQGGSHLLPLYYYRNRGDIDDFVPGPRATQIAGKNLWIFPSIWYANQIRAGRSTRVGPDKDAGFTRTYCKNNGFFPLWNYSREHTPEKNRLDVDSNLLCLLYSYKHEVKPRPAAGADVTDYTRARILWKLWDYQRKDGSVRVDIFPGITYDREEDRKKEIAFLLRFFRYKRTGSRKELDLLYIPVARWGKKD
jgi:hypothetical protein